VRSDARDAERVASLSIHLPLVTRYCFIANTSHTLLINVTTIRIVCNFQKTKDGGHL